MNPPSALTASTAPKNQVGCLPAFSPNATRKVRNPTPARSNAIAVPASTMLGACSSARSSAVSGCGLRWPRGIRSASTPATPNTIAAATSTHSAPVSLRMSAAGIPPTAPAAMLISASRELAVTRAASSWTIAGTSALFATWWPLARTSTPKASGKSSRPLTLPAMRTQSPARPKHPKLMSVRRPLRLRSRSGPITGATSANGATVSSRYSRTFGRAAPGEMLKNSVPASATVTHASPIMLTAWAAARRPNGDSPIVRGSCIESAISPATIVAVAPNATPPEGPRPPRPSPVVHLAFIPARSARHPPPVP